MARYVVLLRAINVGGRNKIPMAELRDLLSELGFSDVATYIQSGNVVCSSRKKPAGVATAIAEGIAGRFGHDISVLVRTADEFNQVADNFPFGEPDAKASSVVFLEDQPAGELDASAFLPDECLVVGADVYLHWHGSFADTKLTPAWIEKQTGLAGTRRNWATIRSLCDLSQ
jgi:uncharacterized protein (DUF1697 family)